MKLFDTHAHVNDGRFDNDRNEMLQACFDTGVEYIMLWLNSTINYMLL